MKWRDLALLGVLSLLLTLGAAALERAPGYMDAEYYYAGARQLANGQGGAEPYLWNYLNIPASLPQPGFGYWMPLVSLLGAVGLRLAGYFPEWWAARLPFMLIAACISPFTVWLSYQLHGRRGKALLSGAFALFPGFYMVYLPTTDSFGLQMLLGGLFFWFTLRGKGFWRCLGFGVLAGLFHLARADGLLWLAAGLAVVLWEERAALRSLRSAGRVLLSLFAVILPYVAIMLPWFARNFSAWGSIFPPGSSRAMWITTYEETFLYPANLLTLQHWLSAGWGSHFAAWGQAFIANLQTWLAVQGEIVLLPFALVAGVQLRKTQAVAWMGGIWLALLAAMTLIFPFAGINGSFLHAGAAFQPLIWALAPLGIEILTRWVGKWRGWQHSERVIAFLNVLLLVTLVLLTAGIYFTRVIGTSAGQRRAWEQSAQHYTLVTARLRGLGMQLADAVMVNDPPGFYLASGQPSLVIPDGDTQMLLAAARQYHARWVVLEITNPAALADLYHFPTQQAGFEYLGKVDETLLFRITDAGGAH